MIQTKELRIDNQIQYYTGEACQISEIKENHIKTTINERYDHCSLYDGIPLTSKILEECGFKINYIEIGQSQYLTYLDKNGFCIQLEQNNENIVERYVIKHIKYVHQLQNLYYTLTGKELKIQL